MRIEVIASNAKCQKNEHFKNLTFGPRQGPRPLPWAKCQIFSATLFICNNINTNLTKNFHTYLIYHSVKPLFLFFQISARSSLKKIRKRKKAGYLPLHFFSTFERGWRSVRRTYRDFEGRSERADCLLAVVAPFGVLEMEIFLCPA